MAGYGPTEIRKPENFADFERKIAILFGDILNDPNVTRVGTSGQRQFGIDLKGYRDSDPMRLVGIQCKLRTNNGKLSLKEIESEISTAITHFPDITEYFIVTTAKDDTKWLDYISTLHTRFNSNGKHIRIEIWGWDTLQDRINTSFDAKNSFDPAFSPSILHQNEILYNIFSTQLAHLSEWRSFLKNYSQGGMDFQQFLHSSKQNHIDTLRLPNVDLVRLRGRTGELKSLNHALHSSSTRIVTIIAWGGTGKTALITEWLATLTKDKLQYEGTILAWSFYSQGSKERAISGEPFIIWLAQQLGLTHNASGPVRLAEDIAHIMRKSRILLILDGLEPLQYSVGPRTGQLKDLAVRTLLRRLAEAPFQQDSSLVVITSRLGLTDLARWKNSSVQILNLKQLSLRAGADLLVDRGVKGTRAGLLLLVKEVDGHALALTLVAGVLMRCHGGKLSAQPSKKMLFYSTKETDDGIYGHARRVLRSIESEWLSDHPVHSSIMYIVGLFDRPAESSLIATLRTSPSLGGIEPAQLASDHEYADALFELREIGLILPAGREEYGTLDAHPLVREWFAEQYKLSNLNGWKNANAVIFLALSRTNITSEHPTLEQMAPLFQSIPHGCNAGLYKETLDLVYRKQICRYLPNGDFEYYAEKILGAATQCLAALTPFFDEPYSSVNPSLDDGEKSWLLNEASLTLLNMGFLRESLQGQLSALSIDVDGENYDAAASQSINIIETFVWLGELRQALHYGLRAIRFAQIGGHAIRVVRAFCWFAYAAFLAGRPKLADAYFRKARALSLQTLGSDLQSLLAYQYCEFLLDNGWLEEASSITNTALQKSNKNSVILGTGLSKLTNSRIKLRKYYFFSSEEYREPKKIIQYFDDSIEYILKSQTVQYTALSYIFRARCFRVVGNLEAATCDLDEAESLSTDAGMLRFAIDIELERCVLELAKLGIEPSHGARNIDRVGQAYEHLNTARSLAQKCSYHRYDKVFSDLNEMIHGSYNLPDLRILL